MTHTERVHIYFGIGLLLIGLLAWRSERRPGGAAAALWPLLVFTVGLLLFIPVEESRLTYRSIGWWGVLRSIVPNDPAHWVSQWWEHARAPHVVQHKIGGLLAMIAGVTELARARGWSGSEAGRLLLPALTIGAGAAFGIHGGSADHLPTAAEQMHHWMLGAGLAVAGLALGLHRTGVVRHPAWRYAWPLIVLLIGAQLVFFYRLPGTPPAHVGH